MNIWLYIALLAFHVHAVECIHKIYRHGKTRNVKDDQVFYPITASWFRDRFTQDEWLATLGDFQSIGGDTVVLRAPGQ